MDKVEGVSPFCPLLQMDIRIALPTIVATISEERGSRFNGIMRTGTPKMFIFQRMWTMPENLAAVGKSCLHGKTSFTIMVGGNLSVNLWTLMDEKLYMMVTRANWLQTQNYVETITIQMLLVGRREICGPVRKKWSVSPKLIMLTTGKWKNEPNGHLHVKANTINYFLYKIELYFFFY